MLVASNLNKSYKKRAVVRNVSIMIKPGEIVGLLGPNGAGKSTSFYIISGLIKPDSGTVYLDHEDITYLPLYKRAKLGISYLPQEPSIFKELTVAENILAALEVTGQSKEKRYESLERLLEDFSIKHLRNSTSALLSGGERRRVEIARCLAIDPKYILLDEPFAGIDPITIDDIQKMIIYLKNMNIGVLITDHNVKEAIPMLDRVYIIYDGTVLAEGPADSIIKNKEVRRLYLGATFS